MKMTQQLYVTSRDEWRRWLERNHDAENEVWLIFYKKHVGKPSIPYEDAVEEALCFGWIDSIIKKIDEKKFVRKFTPRKSSSRWSELNKERVQKMIEARKMTETGMKRVREAEESGEWFKTSLPRKRLETPQYLREALMGNKRAWENFNNLANSYKRQYIGWIASAKREETRKRRLVEAIELLERNEKLGMK